MDITLENVVDFHQTYNQPVGDRIMFEIDLKVRQLRHDLINEEYKELADAESDNNIVEIADALCDLKYVLNGTVIVHGLHPYWNDLVKSYIPILSALQNGHVFRIDHYLFGIKDEIIPILLRIEYFIALKLCEFNLENAFSQLFAEVQRSNMSKTCANLDEVEQTLAKYEAEGIEVDFVEKRGKYVIFRKSDNKTLKGIKYSEPDLKTILLAHGLVTV